MLQQHHLFGSCGRILRGYHLFQSFGATASTPATGCSGTANDVWYSFTATQIQHVITVDGAPNFNAVVELLGGPCGSLTSLACADLTGDGAVETPTYSNLVAGNTYFIRVYDYGSNGDYEFSICITSPVIPTCPAKFGRRCSQCTFVALYFKRTHNKRKREMISRRWTRWYVATVIIIRDSTKYLFFSPAVSGNLSISLTSGSSNVGIMLYDGFCPFIGQGGSCVDYSQSNSGNQFCANVLVGHTYYLVVDRNSGSNLNNYSITISRLLPVVRPAPLRECDSSTVTASLLWRANPTVWGNDYNNASLGSAHHYMRAERIWYLHIQLSVQNVYVLY